MYERRNSVEFGGPKRKEGNIGELGRGGSRGGNDGNDRRTSAAES